VRIIQNHTRTKSPERANNHREGTGRAVGANGARQGGQGRWRLKKRSFASINCSPNSHDLVQQVVTGPSRSPISTTSSSPAPDPQQPSA
jgi:ribosomal protein L19E